MFPVSGLAQYVVTSTCVMLVESSGYIRSMARISDYIESQMIRYRANTRRNEAMFYE